MMPQHTTQALRQRGFNLVELLISMALATTVFMAITTLFVRQSEMMQQQNELIVLNREARFGLDHLRRDLTSLGSNTTPNSLVDPLVCPKPAVQIRALTVDTTNGYVGAVAYNPNVVPTSLTLFGSLDIKNRYKSYRIEGSTITLYDGTLPTSQADMDAIFSVDRFVRIAGGDGQQMFFPIVATSQSSRTITVGGVVPRVATNNTCGYTGIGANYNIDVQNFVRYRVVADSRPGSPVDKANKSLQSLLVRESLSVDGITVKSQLVLVENAVDLQIYDVGYDKDPLPDSLKIEVKRLVDEVFQSGGAGLLGNTNAARPEALRFMTVKLSVRTTWPRDKLVHKPRDVFWQPLDTWLLPDEVTGSHPVISAAARVSFPTLISRNL